MLINCEKCCYLAIYFLLVCLSLFLCLSLLRCQAILTLTINSFDSLTTKVAKINDGYNYNFQLYETAVSFPRIGGHAAATCVHSLRMDGAHSLALTNARKRIPMHLQSHVSYVCVFTSLPIDASQGCVRNFRHV